MQLDSKVCPKCKGKRFFHIADRVTFAGEKAQFAFRGLSDLAKIEGLRVQGGLGNILCLITVATSRTSSSVRAAQAKKIRVLDPETFKYNLNLICDGNVPKKKNPYFKTRLYPGGKVYAWGLKPEQEIELIKYLKKQNMKITSIRKDTLAFAVTTSIFSATPEAKVLKVLGVPVFDYARIRKTLQI